LWNPHAYSLDAILPVLEAKVAEYEEDRRESYRRGGLTRRLRHEQKITKAARLYLSASGIPSAIVCQVCTKGLSDKQSIARGIGSECWGRLLCRVEEIKPFAHNGPWLDIIECARAIDIGYGGDRDTLTRMALDGTLRPKPGQTVWEFGRMLASLARRIALDPASYRRALAETEELISLMQQYERIAQ